MGNSSIPTCNHLPPALIQVRGNYVPHGYRLSDPASRRAGYRLFSTWKQAWYVQKYQMSEQIRLEKMLHFSPWEAHGSAVPLSLPEEQEHWGEVTTPSREGGGEHRFGSHSGRTHPPRVITGPTCSVGPAKGVAATTTLHEVTTNSIAYLPNLWVLVFEVTPEFIWR